VKAARSAVESDPVCAEVSAATCVVLNTDMSFVVSEAMVEVERDAVWEADRDEMMDIAREPYRLGRGRRELSAQPFSAGGAACRKHSRARVECRCVPAAEANQNTVFMGTWLERAIATE
jgi:hypothetical protein